MELPSKEACFLGALVLVLGCAYFDTAAARTAPEFRLTVDTKNFKEIRIPMRLWRRIISKTYGPAEKTAAKIAHTKNPYRKQVTGTTVHEVTLNVVVPENEEDPVVEEEALVEPNVDIVGDSVEGVGQEVSAEAGVEVVEAVEAVEASAEVAAEGATPLSPQDQAAAAAAEVDNGGSVLVQTTRFPCTCKNGTCECCARMFQQKGCANLRFLPDQFAFEMRMTMNGNLLAKRILPVNDPPPFCFNPRRAPFLELCAQLTDISIKKENVHACVDLDASVGGFDLFSWNYDCIKFGRQGFFTGQKRPDSDSDGFDFFGLLPVGGGGGGAGDDEDDNGGLLDGLIPGFDDDDEDDDDEVEDDDDEDY